MPKATRIAVLVSPSNDVSLALFPLEGPPVARQLEVQLQVLEARTTDEIERATDAAVAAKADALWVLGDSIFNNPPQRIPDPAARAKLPPIYLLRDQDTAGGSSSPRNFCG